MTVKAIRSNGLAAELQIDTNITWHALHTRLCDRLSLDQATAKFGYKIIGRDGARAELIQVESQEDFRIAMDALSQLIRRARSKVYSLEISEIVRYRHTSLRTCPDHVIVNKKACGKRQRKSVEAQVSRLERYICTLSSFQEAF